MELLVESFLWHGKVLSSGTMAPDSGRRILRRLLRSYIASPDAAFLFKLISILTPT